LYDIVYAYIAPNFLAGSDGTAVKQFELMRKAIKTAANSGKTAGHLAVLPIAKPSSA